MTGQESLRWAVAGIFWLLALGVLTLNIRRQGINQRYVDAGLDKRASGVPFLFSLFCWLGAAASPWGFNALWYLSVVFEIPALVNFISVPAQTDGKNTDENNNDDVVDDDKR